MNNPNLKKFYQNSPKPVNYLPNVLVDGSPQYAPTMSGLMLINPNTKDIWISAGKEFVSDWISIVGGGGSSITLQTNNTTNPVQNLLNLYSSDGTVQLVDNGVGGVNFSIPTPTKPSKQVQLLYTDQTISLISAFTPIPTFEIPVLVGYTYSFRIFCPFDIDNTNYGTRWSLKSLDSTPVYLAYSTYTTGSLPLGAFVYNNSVTTFNGTPNGPGSTFTAIGNMGIIEGVYTPSQDDILTVTVANEIQAGSTPLTVKAGAYIEYYQISI
jgi:hypothetical protein